MKIISDISLENFEAWSGAKSTLDRIIANNCCRELEAILEDLYPEGMTDTQLNDLLWFEEEAVYEWVGIRSEEQIRAEISDKEDELESLKEELNDIRQEWEDEAEDYDELEEKMKLWDEFYAEDYADKQSEIEEKEAEIEELKEELEDF